MKNKFTDYKLDNSIIKALNNLNYIVPTKVQEEVIPSLIKREDVVVKSKTGSGKTASFGIPLCENINVENTNVQALVVVPTRELALQVKEEISNIGRLKKIRCSAIFGKQPIKEQIRELKQRVHIVVATPGRIIDHIERKTINLDNLDCFIIDEADKMLNKGFVEDMEKIFSEIPSRCTVGLFSATIDKEVEFICQRFMTNPKHIDVEYKKEVSNKQIIEKVIKSEEKEKYNKLKNIIYTENPDTIMIFCNTRERVMRLYSKLREDRFLVGQLHGDMSQDKRIFIIKDFKNSKFNVLVSTDVAARGIHIDDISLVINYDVPRDKENYIHRIGRTGRKDSFGKAITIVSSKDEKYIEEIQEYIEYEIEEIENTNDKDIEKGKLSFNEKSKKLIKKGKEKKSSDNVHSEITKLYLNAGKKKKIRVIDIVGALSNIEGISSDDIGVIEVGDLCSYVDILNNKGNLIIKRYKELSIKKKMVKIRRDNKN